MTSVAEVTSANAAKYAGHPSVVHDAVHGTADPEEIEQQSASLVRSALGSVVTEGVFHVASVGSITELRLDDGRVVVIKAYQPRSTQRFLQAVSDTQAALADAGFACARPLADPQPLGAGWPPSRRCWLTPANQPPSGPPRCASRRGGSEPSSTRHRRRPACDGWRARHRAIRQSPGLPTDPLRGLERLVSQPCAGRYRHTTTARSAATRTSVDRRSGCSSQ